MKNRRTDWGPGDCALARRTEKTRVPATPWRVALLIVATVLSGGAWGCATSPPSTSLRPAPVTTRVLVTRKPAGFHRTRTAFYGPTSRCLRKPHRWVCRTY